MMESVQSSGDNGAVVNFYGELGLDRTWSVEQLRAKLGKLQLHWKRRASLAGKHGEEARERLSVIEAALGTFVDEDAKERYDHLLRHADTVVADDAVNWVARAWTYYFAEDYDAATVAARKARGQGPGDPAAYVVSAWIELAQYEAQRAANRNGYGYGYGSPYLSEGTPAERGFVERAAEYASEAYVLDEDGENAFEVQEVRGMTFHALQQYDRAIDAFEKALAHAPSSRKARLYANLGVLYDKRHMNEQAMLSYLNALQENDDKEIEDQIVASACGLMSGAGVGKYALVANVTALGEVETLHDLIGEYSLSQSSRRRLLAHIDKLIQREEILREIALLDARLAESPRKQKVCKPLFPTYFWIFFISTLFVSYFMPDPHGASMLPTMLPFLIALVAIRFLIYARGIHLYHEAERKYQDAMAEYERDKAIADALRAKSESIMRRNLLDELKGVD